MNIIQTSNDRINNLLDIELRHLDGSKLIKLSTIIDNSDDWRRLLDKLSSEDPVDDDSNRLSSKLRIPTQHITLIEKQKFICDKSPSLALLNHWSITGRRRPTVRTLINYLNACQLKWAEEYVYESILGLTKVTIPRQPKDDINPNSKEKLIRTIDDQFKFRLLDDFLNSLECKWDRFDFDHIFDNTNGFCDKPFDANLMSGTKIGEGRFSSVYRFRTEPKNHLLGEQVLAAKLLKSDCNMDYLANEINLMSRLSHPNLLPLLGISVGYGHPNDDTNNKYLCLIYPFVDNGSLLDCLNHGLCTRNMAYINSNERVVISKKIASGINYLHRLSFTPMIHRDIKTANIFIDNKIEPKIGDFTLLSELKHAHQSETDIMHSSVIGTSVYMAPETFQGDVSTKSDAFSFGIVLLELLTGLKPCVDDLDEDLFSYVNEGLSDIDDELAHIQPKAEEYIVMKEKRREEFLNRILDNKAGEWNFPNAKTIFEISLRLTESRKTNRPEISEILNELESLSP